VEKNLSESRVVAVFELAYLFQVSPQVSETFLLFPGWVAVIDTKVIGTQDSRKTLPQQDF
jgi:hypothetical protein